MKEESSNKGIIPSHFPCEINRKSSRGPKPAAVDILNVLINNGSKWGFITVEENKERDSKSALERKRARGSYEF